MDADQVAGPAVAAPAVQLAAGAGGAINLKIENAKLPIFYGQPGKDTISAQYLIQRVEDLTATNHWSPEDAYHHFSLALQGSAQEWVRLVQGVFDNAEKTWTYIEPLFRKEFSTDEDDSALLDQLSNIQKRPNERIRDYASRIHRIQEVMQRAYTEVPAPPAPANPAGYTQDELLAYTRKSNAKIFKFFSLQLFKVGLPEETRKVLQTQKPATLNKAIDIAREQETTKDKKKPVFAIQDDEDEVDAIQPSFRPNRFNNATQRNTNNNSNSNNWNRRPSQPQFTQRQQPQRQPNQQQQRPRNNNMTNTSKPICVYCRIPGHHQDDCRKRIAAKAPCLSANGKPYYPKSVNEIQVDHQEVDSIVQKPDFHF